MMSHFTPVRFVLLAAVILSAGGAVLAAAPAEEAASDAPAGVLLSQLKEAAAKDRLSDRLLGLFRDYTAARVREAYVPDRIPEPLWTWVLGHQDLRDAVLFGLHPESDVQVGILDRLAALKKAFPEKIKVYPHFALAFAVVYGAAGDNAIRERRLVWVGKERPIPSMEDSFKDYMDHVDQMKIPLSRLPWTLLIYVADNDLPLAEREWVRRRYGPTPLSNLGRVYYDLAYDDDKRRGEAKIGDRPKTMANLLAYGGVCADQSYYASRVAKTFGIPAAYDVGAGARGSHAWLAHVGQYAGGRFSAGSRKQGLDLLFTARFDYDRYFTGTMFDPHTRQRVLDRDVQLHVAAVAHSYEGYLEALAGSRIYALFDGEQRGEVTALLEGAVKRNPFCDAPWRLVAQDVAAAHISARKGEQMYQSMLRQFGQYPDLTFWVLEKILEPRLAVAEDAEARDVSKNLRILETAFEVYAKAERPDLAVKLRCLQGKYLEAAGRKDDALKMYVTASEQYLEEHFGFLDLFGGACRLMKDSGQERLMLKYMGRVVGRVPSFKSDRNRTFGEVNPTYEAVVKMYAKALRAAGRGAEADSQMRLLQDLGKKKG
jgi:hypothetical protein